MKPMIDDFIKYQTASQCWSENPFGRNLKTFENHCLKNFPNQNKLTQEMVNSWCTQRDTELNKSYITRIKVVVLFLKYTNLSISLKILFTIVLFYLLSIPIFL